MQQRGRWRRNALGEHALRADSEVAPAGREANSMPAIRPTAGFPALIFDDSLLCDEAVLLEFVAKRLPRQP